ncbi:MAG: VCBS repeat-containing protein [Candidatus Eisenbacteria bacterium]
MFESHESFPRGGRRWSPSGTRSIAGCLLACLFLIPASPKSGHGQTFLRVLDAGPVVADSVRLFGGNWVDLDADGYLDIYTSGDGNQCYRNEGDGSFSALAGGFVERTGPYWYTMALWADFDNDGAPDLYRGTLGELDPIDLSFLGPGPDVLYRNSGPPDFDMTPIAIGSDTTATLTMSWIDYDRDGDVDLSVSCGLGSSDLFYRNDGGGTFTKLDGLPFLNASPGGAVDSWIDYDGDGDEDYYVVNHATPNRALSLHEGGDGRSRAVPSRFWRVLSYRKDRSSTSPPTGPTTTMTGIPISSSPSRTRWPIGSTETMATASSLP